MIIDVLLLTFGDDFGWLFFVIGDLLEGLLRGADNEEYVKCQDWRCIASGTVRQRRLEIAQQR